MFTMKIFNLESQDGFAWVFFNNPPKKNKQEIFLEAFVARDKIYKKWWTQFQSKQNTVDKIINFLRGTLK
jgi:hypothetical protein